MVFSLPPARYAGTQPCCCLAPSCLGNNKNTQDTHDIQKGDTQQAHENDRFTGSYGAHTETLNKQTIQARRHHVTGSQTSCENNPKKRWTNRTEERRFEGCSLDTQTAHVSHGWLIRDVTFMKRPMSTKIKKARHTKCQPDPGTLSSSQRAFGNDDPHQSPSEKKKEKKRGNDPFQHVRRFASVRLRVTANKQ